MKLQMLKENLVLLPGMDGTGALFDPFLGVLPQNFSTVIVKYPRDKTLGLSQFFPYIREVMPWNEPYTLVAESFGSALAILFAARQPQDIKAIVLVNSFLSNPLPPLLKWSGIWKKDFLFQHAPPRPLLKKWLLGEDCSDVLMDSLASAIAHVRPEVLALRARMILETDLRDVLRAVEKPILYLLGTEDKLIGNRGWKQVASVKPSAVCVPIKGPHLLLQRQPQECLQAIARFLQSDRQAAPAGHS